MSRIIIGLAGKKQSGKNSVGRLIKLMANKDLIEVSYAETLKDVCATLTGTKADYFELESFKQSVCPITKTSYRMLLIDIGDAIRRVNKDFFVNALFSKYPKGNLIVTDVRYPNEVKAIKDLGGVIIRINRDNIDLINHPTETSLDDYEFDFTVDNNATTKELGIKVQKLLIELNLISKD